jgi:hypothetical protein
MASFLGLNGNDIEVPQGVGENGSMALAHAVFSESAIDVARCERGGDLVQESEGFATYRGHVSSPSRVMFSTVDGRSSGRIGPQWGCL